mmetsp:Transcript_13931/g.23200  ORF Transcript_13931/g.23200 Transcript_13931/m.23200 type:complete len:200 (+) Transcript_13931:326-925(+)
MKSELVGHFSSAHGVRKILLVSKHKKDGITELILIKHSVQLISRGVDAIRVVRIDNKDQTLGILVVVAPKRADLILTSDVPNGEGDVLVLNGLDVKTNGWNSGNNFTELQFVKDGCLSCCIETDHENSHLFLSEHTFEQTRKSQPHLGLFAVAANNSTKQCDRKQGAAKDQSRADSGGGGGAGRVSRVCPSKPVCGRTY